MDNKEKPEAELGLTDELSLSISTNAHYPPALHDKEIIVRRLLI